MLIDLLLIFRTKGARQLKVLEVSKREKIVADCNVEHYRKAAKKCVFCKQLAKSKLVWSEWNFQKQSPPDLVQTVALAMLRGHSQCCKLSIYT
eukprot:5098138-Amphidinium_carterae.2